MQAYYNDSDTYCCAWLTALMAQGHITPGHVEERSIEDVRAVDLMGITRAHFFAGIGGWDRALALAGWPSDTPIWTASVPCQPFSVAGRRRGTADARHLWPAFFRLIRECQPQCVVGEQVPGAIAQGWLDGISADLEGAGYAVGTVVLGAHSVGAPHQRQRLYWGAVRLADSGSLQPGRRVCRSGEGAEAAGEWPSSEPIGPGNSGGMADTESKRYAQSANDGGRRKGVPAARQAECRSWHGSGVGGLGDSTGHDQRREGECSPGDRRQSAAGGSGFWSKYDITFCRDGKTRRIKSRLLPVVARLPFLLADGRTRENVSRREILKGIGNAIVPQVAAVFLRGFCAASQEVFSDG